MRTGLTVWLISHIPSDIDEITEVVRTSLLVHQYKLTLQNVRKRKCIFKRTFSTRSISSRLFVNVSSRRTRRSFTISQTRVSSSHFGWTTSFGHGPRTFINCWPNRIDRKRIENISFDFVNVKRKSSHLTCCHNFFGSGNVRFAHRLKWFRFPDHCVDSLHSFANLSHFGNRFQMRIKNCLQMKNDALISSNLKKAMNNENSYLQLTEVLFKSSQLQTVSESCQMRIPKFIKTTFRLFKLHQKSTIDATIKMLHFHVESGEIPCTGVANNNASSTNRIDFIDFMRWMRRRKRWCWWHRWTWCGSRNKCEWSERILCSRIEWTERCNWWVQCACAVGDGGGCRCRYCSLSAQEHRFDWPKQ